MGLINSSHLVVEARPRAHLGVPPSPNIDGLECAVLKETLDSLCGCRGESSES